MPNLNKVMLMGNLTHDIELRYTPKGSAVCDITLAINRYRIGENGERNDETTFVDITLWGKTAEVVHQYCGKGRPLFVEGRLHRDTWVDKTTGTNRSKMKVIGERIEFLDSRGSGNSGNTPQQAPQQQSVAPQQPQQPSVQQAPQQPVQQPNTPPQGGSPAMGGPIEETDDIPF